jgi:hypothetical protein
MTTGRSTRPALSTAEMSWITPWVVVVVVMIDTAPLSDRPDPTSQLKQTQCPHLTHFSSARP